MTHKSPVLLLLTAAGLGIASAEGISFWLTHLEFSPSAIAIARVFLLVTALLTGIELALRRDTRDQKNRPAHPPLETDSRRLFETHHAVIIVVDPTDCTVYDVNPAGEQFYGWTRAQMRGMPLADINTLPPDRIRDAIDATVADERHVFNMRHRVADGSVRDVQVFSSRVVMDGRELLYAIVFDVTERHRVQMALVESERRLSTLMCNLPGMVYRCQVDEDWTMLFVSDGCEALTGYKPEDLLHNNRISFGQLIHPDDTRRVWCELHSAAERHEPFVIEYRLMAADGTEKWVWEQGRPVLDDDGALVALEGYILDVTDRERARQALIASEERYRELVENAPIGIFTTCSAGRMVEVNRCMARILRCNSPQETVEYYNDLRNRLYSEPCDREMFVGRLLEEGRIEEFEYEARARDGMPVWLNVSARVARRESDGSFLIEGFAADITERKRAEFALRESEERFRLLVEGAPDAIFIQVESDFAYLNLAAIQLFGATDAHDLIWKPVLDRVHPSRRAEVDELIRTAPENGLPLREEVFLRLDGSEVPVEMSAIPIAYGNQTGSVVFMRDITQRKQTEREWKHLLSAIEQSGEIIMIADMTGNIRYVNPAFERTTGYSRAEVLGQNPRILKSGLVDPQVYVDLWRTLTSGEIWRGRLINRRKNGTTYTEDAIISPVRDSAGTVISFVAVKRDVTRELQLESQLRQAQKMEAVGQLAGGIAHDFNNLLTVINGYAELLAVEAERDDHLKPLIDEIGKAGQRAARLVSQMLAFSRRQVMRPETVDLNKLIDDILSMLRRVIGEHIRLEWLPGHHLGAVHADSGMLEQAIMNLVINARDAMPDGGVLVIETQNVLIDSKYCEEHAWATPGRYVLLSITDNGRGMDPETLEHIFEPFFTTKSELHGTGLGLAMVYGIVKQHHGMINVYSEPGTGTTFKIYLPLCERRAEAVGTLIPPTSATGGSETVLIAEDDQMVRELARKILEDAGYTVHAARDGVEAVSLFKEHAVQIDLVVLDVVMPRMGGRDAYEKIRELQPDVRVLFASGYSENAVHTNFVLHDGLELLQKPYAPRDLLRAIRTILER